jgi:hypothetical protein
MAITAYRQIKLKRVVGGSTDTLYPETKVEQIKKNDTTFISSSAQNLTKLDSNLPTLDNFKYIRINASTGAVTLLNDEDMVDDIAAAHEGHGHLISSINTQDPDYAKLPNATLVSALGAKADLDPTYLKLLTNQLPLFIQQPMKFLGVLSPTIPSYPSLGDLLSTYYFDGTGYVGSYLIVGPSGDYINGSLIGDVGGPYAVATMTDDDQGLLISTTSLDYQDKVIYVEPGDWLLYNRKVTTPSWIEIKAEQWITDNSLVGTDSMYQGTSTLEVTYPAAENVGRFYHATHINRYYYACNEFFMFNYINNTYGTADVGTLGTVRLTNPTGISGKYHLDDLATYDRIITEGTLKNAMKDFILSDSAAQGYSFTPITLAEYTPLGYKWAQVSTGVSPTPKQVMDAFLVANPLYNGNMFDAWDFCQGTGGIIAFDGTTSHYFKLVQPISNDIIFEEIV